MSKDKGLSRPAWWALMAVTGVTVAAGSVAAAAIWAVGSAERAIERLCGSAGQDDDDTEPEPIRDSPSDFSSLNDD